MQHKSYAHIIFYYQKLNKPIFCLLFIFFILNKTEAQQFNNWYFSLQNGISFNTTPPSFLSGSQIGTTPLAPFGSAVISDKKGQLLFSTDGVKVFDKNNNQMPNGFGLKGQFCQTNGSLIVPFVNDTSKYYLFTSQGLVGTSMPDTARYSYSILDMSLNSSLGDVVIKNVDIRGFASEKMLAIPHKNGTDIWWVCRDRTNNFYSYKITCTGFQNSNPVISSIGSNTNNNINLLIGDIKASNDGKTIAAAYSFTGASGEGYFEAYEFDNSTGILSNPIKINGFAIYGIEFSPNSKILYVTQRFETNNIPYSSVTQYSLTNYDSFSIKNSLFDISSTVYPFGNGIETCLQLGPDNKIYIPVSFTNNSGIFLKGLDVINNPNELGAACNYQSQVISLPNMTRRRLPYSYTNLITAQNVQIPNYTVASDCRTVTLKGKTYIKGNNLTFKWKFGDGDSTVQIVPSGGDTTFASVTHFYPPGIDTFHVQLFVTSDTVCGLGSIGKRLTLPKKSTIKANFDFQKNCGQLLVQFTDSSTFSNISNNLINYQWQFFNKNNLLLGTSIEKNPIFTFPNFDTVKARLIVSINSIEYCSQADTLEKILVLFIQPNSSFNNSAICLGEQVTFNNTSNNTGLIVITEWLLNNTLVSNNSNGFSYTFNQAGNYIISLKSTTANGCSTIATKNILVETALANAGRDTTVLENQPFVLLGSGGTTYFWQPPIGLDDITKANPTGTLINNQQYVLRTTTAQGCISFDTVFITVLRNLIIPNAFSPNGDGINETWGIEQLKDYPNAVVQIFNRNGQLMYTAKGNNITAWNGTINNKPVPVGTYYYVITLNNLLRNKPISGWVMVVR